MLDVFYDLKDNLYSSLNCSAFKLTFLALFKSKHESLFHFWRLFVVTFKHMNHGTECFIPASLDDHQLLGDAVALTVNERMDPMTLPSSYLPSLDWTLSSTDTSLATRLARIEHSVFSIRSSIFVWYLCCNDNNNNLRHDNNSNNSWLWLRTVWQWEAH